MGRKSTSKKLRNTTVESKTENASKSKPKANLIKKVADVGATTVPTKQLWILTAFLVALAFVLNSNTFSHRFVLDDHGIIKNNKITKAPLSAENTKLIFTTPLRKGDFSDLENSLYRPFTKFIFNVEWNWFGGNAHRFHQVNVLFYALLCGLMFWVLYDLFKKKWVVPFLATLLFVVHPIHTEVVANVKSGDEILGLLGIVLALRFLQLYLTEKKTRNIVLACVAYLMGLFSKESAVVAVAIFPLFIYYSSEEFNLKKIATLSLPFLICALVFLIARQAVLGQYPQAAETSAMDNFMVLADGPLGRFASAVMVLGFYIYTFFVPHPLSCDYSYSSFEPVTVGHLGFLVSFILLIGTFVYAVRSVKNKNLIGFGILWFFITVSLVSNVFFLIGTSFGERLLFAPTLGLCLLTVAALAKFFEKENRKTDVLSQIKSSPVLWGIVCVVSVLYSFKTYSRNKDWRTDYQLFSTDIESYPNATHLLFYMGNHLSGDERKEVLTEELSNLGFNNQQITDSIAKESNKSISYFNRSLGIYPALPSDGYNQLGKAYFRIGNLDSAFKYYNKALALDSTNGIFVNNVGTVYYNRNQIYESMPYFIKAHSLDTSESDFMNNIGCVYGVTQKPDSAIYWFAKASAADSMDLTSLKFLDITYRNMGNIQQADYYKNKATYVENARRNMLK